MAETLNMMEISVDRFVNEIKLDLEDENYDPVIGIGKSGVGKTMSIYELTQELGIGFCELRLVTLTETDMLGIPDVKVNPDGSRTTTYASNDLLPVASRDGEKGILVLDEITSATSTIRAAAYQLLDSKRALGNYKLPPKWKVIALGNGPDDGGVFQGMESAFLSRATCYRIEPNLESWKKWAIKNGVNPTIIAYLTFDPTMLHVFNPDEIASVFPCPRSWTALSKKLNAREKRCSNGILATEQVELYAAGAIGKDVASKFAGFYEYNGETIAPEDILSGASNGEVVDRLQPEVVYLVIQQVIRQLNTELGAGRLGLGEFKPECTKRAANVAHWLIAAGNKKLDYAVTGIRDLQEGVALFNEMVLLNIDFDDMCPELMIFADRHGLIFSSN